ncbi:MAG: 2,3-bisphosphoglycerate-independent phosphoglycerate mutase, partial [Deltaproteobacteria bacterium]|nr:2,3-bisphosphoglycerate-independent phosphoglycerate mutase [Deltaproteobacteria bacterium]
MRPVALIVLDGWGYRPDGDASNNAILQARTPRLSALQRDYAFTTLSASGLDVGLPAGQMGNSEVGHLNLGAGRIVYQDLTRINLAIENGTFFENPVLLDAFRRVGEAGSALHFMGLLSDGGVHSHQRHLYALLELARRSGVERAFVHAFLDGRDTPPQSGREYVAALEEVLADVGYGRTLEGGVATVTGRFYAMDRDTRWERVEKAFRAVCCGVGIPAFGAVQAVEEAYAAGETDEFVVPRVVFGLQGRPIGTMAGGDTIVFFNFRADRARELTRAFTQERFSGFDASPRPRLSSFVTFTQYDEAFDLPIAFPPVRLTNILGEVFSRAGARQLRIAETEKYAHVTFFFNGGEEEPFPREERILIPSPREVATYDQKPEMSAFGVRDRLVQEIRERRPDAIVVNFANLDMVGHTGLLPATVRAVEAVDACVGDVVDALREKGYAAIVTADHGNAEEMWDAESG